MKQCTKCGKTKPLSEFCKDKSGKDGHTSQCRACRKAYDAARKEERAVYAKAYYIAHREEEAVYRKAYNATHKEEIANRNLKRDYGITLEDKRQMWKDQDGRCAICNKKLSEGRDCCVDHCHVTGKVRGMLYNRCNVMLARANDDSVILQRAINYLEA